LGEVALLKRGYDLPARERREGSVPVVSSRGVSGSHDTPRARAPGVVTGRTGTIGRVFYVERDFWPLNTTLYVADFRGNDPRFVACLLETIDYGALNDKAAVPGVSPRHLHDVLVARPPLEAQRAAAAAVARLDRRRDLLLSLDARVAGMGAALHALLPRGRPRPLAELCVEIGSGTTPPRRDRASFGGDTPWYRSGDLDDAPLVCAPEGLTDHGLARARVWPAGTVLFAMYAAPTVGRLGLLVAPAAANQACAALVPRSGHGAHFVFHALLATRDRLRALAAGAAQQNVNLRLVREHEVLVPQRGAALAFDRKAARLHALRAAYRRELVALAALRQATLGDLLAS
jgi:type I restriction enzyme S subunit